MEISPEKQNIEKVFSNTEYFIDFYQREYKWSQKEVLTLLDDIFHKFNLDYNKDLEPNDRNIMSSYSWYYLNTYITNNEEGKVYLVDGQQRLTTLTLILLKIYHLYDKLSPNNNQKEWVKQKILGYSSSGLTFWIGQSNRSKVLEKIFTEEDFKIDNYNDISETNLLKNYKFISEYFDNQIKDEHRLLTFALYFMKRLVLINLEVGQTNVPMVFEVINDRGVRLKPYEILKGKLLGQIHKNEVEEYYKIWLESLQMLEFSEKELVDDFFRTYFKAELTKTRSEGRKFDGDYHKAVFESPYNEILGLKNNPSNVKNFIKGDFNYSCKLYKQILKLGETKSEEFQYVYFNTLTEMNNQVMLIMAACSHNDPLEKQKIDMVSREFDRLYVLLQLNKSYDSNRMNDLVYPLNELLRNSSIDNYRAIFDRIIIEEINNRRNAEVTSPFNYHYFKELKLQDFNKTFIRYFFARIELFISTCISKEMQNNIYDLVKNTGPVNGYHIEHILSRNQENLAIYNNDETKFEDERNQLGALLLLRGQENQKSSNEVYANKLQTYENSLFWNRTLCPNVYYHTHKSFNEFKNSCNLDFKPIENFDTNAREERSKLLFDMVKIIWK